MAGYAPMTGAPVGQLGAAVVGDVARSASRAHSAAGAGGPADQRPGGNDALAMIRASFFQPTGAGAGGGHSDCDYATDRALSEARVAARRAAAEDDARGATYEELGRPAPAARALAAFLDAPAGAKSFLSPQRFDLGGRVPADTRWAL